MTRHRCPTGYLYRPSASTRRHIPVKLRLCGHPLPKQSTCACSVHGVCYARLLAWASIKYADVLTAMNLFQEEFREEPHRVLRFPQRTARARIMLGGRKRNRHTLREEMRYLSCLIRVSRGAIFLQTSAPLLRATHPYKKKKQKNTCFCDFCFKLPVKYEIENPYEQKSQFRRTLQF